jgi:hypothetical protein
VKIFFKSIEEGMKGCFNFAHGVVLFGNAPLKPYSF